MARGGMPDVVVVGAGLAGLRCAHDLVRGGADVVVLEARHRVGGRVFSHHFADGQHCERGAEFIDGNHTEVIALAGALGLRLSNRANALDPHGTLLDSGGRAVPIDLHASIGGDAHRWEVALRGLADDDVSDTRSLAELMDGIDPPLSPLSKLVIGRDIRTEYMLPPEEVSQRFAARNAAVQNDAEREVHRVIGGNDQLATRLAAMLGDRVRLGSPVASVDTRATVTMLSGGSLRAAAVVAAVPLPVLSRLWPEMPQELGAVGYGIGGKISVQFSRRVWRDYGRTGDVISDRAWGRLWETTDDQPGDSGVLTNLLASHDGASFAALPESPEQLVREIDRVFPGAKGLAGERVHTDWTNDPFSLGAYACFGPGQIGAAQPLLDAQHGRLWLAGEHTDRFAGFMEGALRSGARAAAAVAAALS